MEKKGGETQRRRTGRVYHREQQSVNKFMTAHDSLTGGYLSAVLSYTSTHTTRLIH